MLGIGGSSGSPLVGDGLISRLDLVLSIHIVSHTSGMSKWGKRPILQKLTQVSPPYLPKRAGKALNKTSTYITWETGALFYYSSTWYLSLFFLPCAHVVGLHKMHWNSWELKQVLIKETICYMVAEIVAYFLLIPIFHGEIEMSSFHSMLLLASLCPIGFEFRSILLLDWFSTKAREPSLLCYLCHSLGVEQKK